MSDNHPQTQINSFYNNIWLFFIQKYRYNYDDLISKVSHTIRTYDSYYLNVDTTSNIGAPLVNIPSGQGSFTHEKIQEYKSCISLLNYEKYLPDSSINMSCIYQIIHEELNYYSEKHKKLREMFQIFINNFYLKGKLESGGEEYDLSIHLNIDDINSYFSKNVEACFTFQVMVNYPTPSTNVPFQQYQQLYMNTFWEKYGRIIELINTPKYEGYEDEKQTYIYNLITDKNCNNEEIEKYFHLGDKYCDKPFLLFLFKYSSTFSASQ
jgi:hypothetical protein